MGVLLASWGMNWDFLAALLTPELRPETAERGGVATARRWEVTGRRDGGWARASRPSTVGLASRGTSQPPSA